MRKVEVWGVSFEYEDEDSEQAGPVHEKIDAFLKTKEKTESEFINGNQINHYQGGILDMLDKKGRRRRFGFEPSQMRFEHIKLIKDLTKQEPVHWVVILEEK